MERPRIWREPDYPNGEWMDQDDWVDAGMDEVFQYASEAGIPEGANKFPAFYNSNDIGSQRVIPLYIDEDQIGTIGGVFDSNPGYSQRYTPWNASFEKDEFLDELEYVDGQIVELEKEHLESINAVTTEDFRGLYRTLLEVTAFFR